MPMSYGEEARGNPVFVVKLLEGIYMICIQITNRENELRVSNFLAEFSPTQTSSYLPKLLTLNKSRREPDRDG